MDLPSLPAHLLSVSPEEFSAMLLAAAEQWAARQTDPYSGGVFVCAQWIAGIHDRHPLTTERTPVTADTLAECQMAGDAIVYGLPGAMRGLNFRYAEGVAWMVAWARGATRWPPIRPHSDPLVA